MNLIYQWHHKLRRLDGTESFRAKVAMGIAMLMVVLYGIAAPARHAVEPLTPTAIFEVSLAFFFCAVSIVTNLWRPSAIWAKFAILLALFVIVPGAGFRNGGMEAPIMALNVLLPVGAAFLMGFRAALLYSGLGVGVFGALLWADMLGLLPESGLAADKISRARFVINTALVALSFLMAWMYERARIASYRELQEVQDSHPNGLAKLDGEGAIVFMNEKFKKMFPDAAFDMNFPGELCRAGDLQSEHALDKWMISAFEEKVEARLPTGRWVELQVIKSHARNAEWTLLVSDIHARKSAEDLALQLVEVESKRALIATYNHAINNPLAIAMLQLQTLKRKKLVPEEHLVRIDESLNRVADVVRKLQELDRDELTEQEPYPGGGATLKAVG